MDNSEVTLEIEENGVGFNVPNRLIQLAHQGQFKLVSAIGRTEAVGGKMRVFSESGQGTKIRVNVPLDLG